MMVMVRPGADSGMSPLATIWEAEHCIESNVDGNKVVASNREYATTHVLSVISPIRLSGGVMVCKAVHTA